MMDTVHVIEQVLKIAGHGVRKARPNSIQRKLTREQQTLLERWLFGEQGSRVLTYLEAAVRVEKEFGVRLSESALRRFYRRCDERRIHDVKLKQLIKGEQPEL